MLAGIIITTDGNAQIFGTEIDFEKLAEVIEQLLPQLKQGADQQRQTRLQKLLNEVDASDLEAALKNREK